MATITTRDKGVYTLVEVDGRAVLGYSPQSGVRIMTVDGLPFKDFLGTGRLVPYEDWRLAPEERARDLASRLSIDEIAGLMLYSPQNWLPMPHDTYGGRPFAESGMQASDLSDSQRQFLERDNVRHVLVGKVQDPETAARWSNNVQAFCEGRTHGIPANNSSDPRHSATADAEFAAGAGGHISQWSGLLGLAATFDPDVAEQFGRTAAREYRLLGITTALSPQADLGTDPRWYRFSSTFGSDPRLVADMTRAYADGFQSQDRGGWGSGSVNTMAKHWPGGGSGEGGRDAHYGNGKYAVYPGHCYEQHKVPFLEGAFALKGKTGRCSAVMPYYTISYGQTGENVANSYNRDIITRQLRQEAGYDGVVCTDWLITHDEQHPGTHSGKPWGVEHLSEAQRHYKALMAGVDQFGGNDKKEPVLQAYRMGVAEHGEQWMRKRFEQSAYRLLLNMFRVGLFDNPYIDPDDTRRTVGCPRYMALGYAQQLKSVIMLKNHGGVLPLAGRAGEGTRGGTRGGSARPHGGPVLYIPKRRSPEGPNYWRQIVPERIYDPVPGHVLDRYFAHTDNPDGADAAVVFIESPHSWLMGYDPDDVQRGGNGYIPISLQYAPYTATHAREHSIAGGDPFEAFTDRSYRGKSTHTINSCDLDLVRQTRRAIGPHKPLVLVVNMLNPAVMAEVEPLADAILIGFDVQAQAYIDIIAGRAEPSALLPFQLPRDMQAVEEHCEDRPRDIAPYRDADGHLYDFGFGLGWAGPIADWRTERYR